ncbi:MAG: hypothetical protein ACKVQK_15835 [Burkholderiales bacterium]
MATKKTVSGLRTGAVAKRSKRVVKPATDPGNDFCAAAALALKRGDIDAISDATLRRVLTSAVKLYAAKMDGREDEIPPFEKNRVNATETVVASCAMIRAAGLNLFDVAMWFRRSAAGL